MISTHLYLYKHVLSDIGNSSFKKEGKTQIFKMYIFVKLFKENETKHLKI
jgi:hypothetical protein